MHRVSTKRKGPRTILIITTVLYPDTGYGVNVYGVNEKLAERHRMYFENISHNLEIIKGLDIEVIIVENSAYKYGVKHTFLDNFGLKVHYTNSSMLMLDDVEIWKEIREISDMRIVCKSLKCNDNDVIIKLSGLCKLENNSFMKTVEIIHDNYDIVYKKCQENKLILGLIAIKYHFLREADFSLESTTRERFCPEAMYYDNICMMISEKRRFIVERLGLIRPDYYKGVPEYI